MGPTDIVFLGMEVFTIILTMLIRRFGTSSLWHRLLSPQRRARMSMVSCRNSYSKEAPLMIRTG